MVMIRYIIIVSILMVITGCTHKPPATIMPTPTLMPTLMPTPTLIPTKAIDEKVILIDTLSTFNKGSNDFYEFLSASTSIEWLEGTPVQKSFVHTLVTISGLKVYKQTIILWNPPEELNAYDDLIKMKEAELYRVDTFSDLLQTLQDDLNTGDVDQINRDYENLATWSDSPENTKSLDIQAELLKRFGIPPEEVDFNWTRPEIESDEKLPTA